MGDRKQPGCFWAVAAIGGDIGPVHDLGQPLEGRVIKSVLDDDRFKAASAVHVPKLYVFDVVGDRTMALGHRHHLVGVDVDELRRPIHELGDQPWARDTVDASVLAGYPLHRMTTFCSGFRPITTSAECRNRDEAGRRRFWVAGPSSASGEFELDRPTKEGRLQQAARPVDDDLDARALARSKL